MDKELDQIYDYGNLSPGEQEQWSSEQSGTENMWQEEEESSYCNERKETWQTDTDQNII